MNALNLRTDIALTQIGGYDGGVTGEAGFLGAGPLERTIGDDVEPVVLSLVDALQVGARGSRDYQAQKEAVFVTALALDLERDAFEFRFAGTLDATVQSELEGADTSGVVITPAVGVTKLFKSGAAITSRIGLDIARLLGGDGGESLGLFADASVTVPLLRGAGVEVVTEPLQQAERDAVYAIWDFERFKREFAVNLAARYFGVLQNLDAISNSEANYQRLRYNAERSRAFFEVGELPAIQVDQAVSNELEALTRLIAARQRYEDALDQFKVFLGLPPDAAIALDRGELGQLRPLAERVLGRGGSGLLDLYPEGPLSAEELREATDPARQPGVDLPAETIPEPADPEAIDRDLADIANPYDDADLLYRASGIRVALANRLDLSIAIGAVADAQRRVVVAADGLEAIVDATAGGSLGSRRGAFSGGLDNDIDLNAGSGSYSGGLRLDLPIERTAERNAYRVALINLDRAVRAAQETEDGVKIDVLTALRSIRVAAENLRIQAQSIAVAQRRVTAANLLLELGRGEVRDVTEAEDALVDAQNGFTSALIGFYISELELQRDLGVLKVAPDGLFDAGDDLIRGAT